jgi:hypothetical protein
MRWGRAGALLPAALLALAGCNELRSGEQPDEIGTNKPGDFGEREQEESEAREHARQQPAEMDAEAETVAPPEGYRDRGEVVGETGATADPNWQGGQLQEGQAEEGAPARAGFEQDAQEGAQADEPAGEEKREKN